MSDYDDKPQGFFGRLFGIGQKKAEAISKSQPTRKSVTFASGDRLEMDVLEVTSFTVVARDAAGKIHRFDRMETPANRERGAWVTAVEDVRAFDAARSSTAGAPGDEGTLLFGKEGPRKWDRGGVRAAAEQVEANRATAQSLDAMTPLRARIFACFLAPPPKRERELVERAHSLGAIVSGVVESEGKDPATLSAVAMGEKRVAVKAECEAMKAVKLLARVSPPEEPGFKWESDPDTYSLTGDGASQAWAVYEVATGKRS